MSDPERAAKTLTLSFVRHVTAPGRYYDQDGLILTVSPSGGKSWTQRLTIQGRRRDIGLGSAHVITPAQARTMAAKNKAIARAGGNPLAPRTDRRVRADKLARTVTFAAFSVTRYRRLRTAPGAEEQARENYQRVRLHANPLLGRLAISEITEDDVVRTLLSAAETSRNVARWLRQHLAPIFDEAMNEGLRSDNPARSPAVTSMVKLEPVRVVKDSKGKVILDQLPEFLRRIEQDHRRPASFMLIRFCLLTARNPGECRLATWPQIDFERRLWRFPRMQTPGKPIVELALHEGHIKILDRVRSYSIGGMQGYIFPSRQGIDKAFSDPSLSISLRRAGYDLVLMNFQQAHRAWVSSEGGNADDLYAWWERLRHPPDLAP